MLDKIAAMKEQDAELARLREINAELLAALETIDSWLVCYPLMHDEDFDKGFPEMHWCARDAITKAAT